MRIGLLGPLEVRDDDPSAGATIEVSGVRLRALLIRLAVDAPAQVSASVLIDALWGDDPPSDAGNALQSLVSRLRKALGDAERIVASPGGYRLNVHRDEIDLHRFAALARAGRAKLRAGDAQAAATMLRQALGLWREPTPETWGDATDAASYRARLHDQWLEARADLLEAELDLDHHGDVVVELGELAVQFPLREHVAGLLMRALAATGRQSEALAHYEQVRHRLADELGVDPSRELQAIHLAIVRGEHQRPPTPADSPPRRRGNLKAALTSFVGRDDEVARIAKLLEESRLITLVGPGGAGKTRLACVAASAIVDSMPDGVWLAELAPVTDPADVASAVLDSLDVRDAALLDRPTRTNAAAMRDATSKLIDALAPRRCVLLLDNCEHVIDAAARLADELLAQCASLRIITTSREPLGIVGETLVVVPPLAQPDPGAAPVDALAHPAARLFADRAAAVNPEFEVDDETVTAVVEIVRRLDGLPLAIELAAARLRSLAVGEIAARLSDRFRLLTGGSRTAMPRHRTLRAVVEWSWDLLSPIERVFAERLAVFSGSFAPHDAQAVCSGGDVASPDVDDLLASLVDKSLLQITFDTGEQRYRMLETLREFGLERMAERGEVIERRQRHAERYAALVREASPHTRRAEQLEWMARLEVERDNILTALRFFSDDGRAQAALDVALDMATYWTITGRHTDAANWLALALRASGETDRVSRLGAEALQAVNAVASSLAREPEKIEANMRRLRELGHELETVEAPSDSMFALLRPVIAVFSDEPAERIERLVDEGLASTDPWIVATVRMFRAGVAENNGDPATMRAESEIALAAFRDLGERWGMASCLGMLAQLKAMDGDVEGAITDIEEALVLTERMTGNDDAVMLNVRLAQLRLYTGDVEGAHECVAAVKRLTELVGTSFHEVFTQILVGEIARIEGDLAEARRQRDQSLAFLAGLPTVHPIKGHLAGMVIGFAAKISTGDGEFATAHSQLCEAYGYAVATKDMPIIASVGVGVALLAAAEGKFVDAAELLGAAARLRGAEDAMDLDLAKVTATLRNELGAKRFATSYRTGRSLDPKAALARLDPATLGAPPVSP